MRRIQQMAAIALLALLLAQPISAATGFTTQQGLYYTGDSASPGNYYKDSTPTKGNDDVGVELCGAGPSNYVGAFYALPVGATWYNTLITYDPSVQALVQTGSSDVGGGCYQTTAGGIVVSPSQFTGSPPDPDVQRAAFPGQLWIGYDAGAANPGTVSNFVFASSNAQLRGGYGYSSGTAASNLGPTRTFNQGSLTVDVSTPYIHFDASGSDTTKIASDASHGLATDRRMVVGLCDDSLPSAESTTQTCFDALVADESGDFPVTFATGLAAPSVNDQNIHTRNVVINGLGYEMCIGANLQTSVSGISPDPVYYSQNLTISISTSNPRGTPTETNGGNVDVTSPFEVYVEIYPQGNPGSTIYTTTYNVSTTLGPSGSTLDTVVWPAIAQSGTYTVRVTADNGNDINECNEGDNIATASFELKPITIPVITIDGTETDVFPYPNVPYNLSFYLKNSDNDTLSNASVTIVEENGLNLLAPTQIYNRSIGGTNTTKDGLRVQTRVDFLTDAGGNASFAFMPTYNKLYLPTYGYTELDSYIGNYSLYFTGTQSDGEEFVFVENGNIRYNYSFSIGNTSYLGPYASKDVPSERMVGQVMDFVYQAFNTFLETVVN